MTISLKRPKPSKPANQLLSDIDCGGVAAELIPLVYDELRRLAAHYVRRERSVTGAAAVSWPVANSLATPTLKVGGAAAQVQFAGLTPGSVGLVQINIQLPPTLPAGNSLPMAIAFGTSAAPTVNLAVR